MTKVNPKKNYSAKMKFKRVQFGKEELHKRQKNIHYAGLHIALIARNFLGTCATSLSAMDRGSLSTDLSESPCPNTGYLARYLPPPSSVIFFGNGRFGQ